MAGEWLGLDVFSWAAILAGSMLMACSLFLDWRLERLAPGRYHGHSGGAIVFAAAFWAGGLMRQPGSPAMSTTYAALGVAGIVVFLFLLCGLMWWSDLDLVAEAQEGERHGG